MSGCDRLPLKPIAFNRFVIAANKLRTPTSGKNNPLPLVSTESVPSSHRFFNVNKTMIKIDLQEIRYVESLKEYVRIVTGDQSIVTKGSLQEFEQMLMDFGGLRIHRSFWSLSITSKLIQPKNFKQPVNLFR